MQLKRIQFLMIVTYENSYAVHTIYHHITSVHVQSIFVLLVLLTDISPKSITFNLSYFSLRFICMVSCKRQYGLIKVKHLFCQDICE